MKIIILFVSIIIIFFLTFYWLPIPGITLYHSYGNIDSWIQIYGCIFGNIIGGFIGGYIAFLIAKKQIDEQKLQSKMDREDSIKLEIEIETSKLLIENINNLVITSTKEAILIRNLIRCCMRNVEYYASYHQEKRYDGYMDDVKDDFFKTFNDWKDTQLLLQSIQNTILGLFLSRRIVLLSLEQTIASLNKSITEYNKSTGDLKQNIRSHIAKMNNKSDLNKGQITNLIHLYNGNYLAKVRVISRESFEINDSLQNVFLAKLFDRTIQPTQFTDQFQELSWEDDF